MNTFDHFGTNKGTACYYTVEGNHFTEMLGSKGTWVDVMVAEGTFEADIEDCVVVDVGVLNCSESHCCFFQGAIEGRKKVGGLGKDT